MAKVKLPSSEPYLRFEGCPVSVSEQVLALCFLAGSKNPILDASESIPFNKAYLQWRSAMAVKRLQGVAYQRAGACHRGHARPEME